MNAYLFIIFILLTFFISIAYIYGYKENYKLIKSVSKKLEDELKPIDKTYTWLGGVIGFSATYMLKEIGSIKILFATIPRQSILFLPFSIIMRKYDKIEVLIPFNKKIKSNITIIRCKPYFKLKRKNNFNLKRVYIKENSHRLIIDYDGNYEIVSNIVREFSHFFRYGLYQFELTKKDNACYLKLNKNGLNIIKEIITKINKSY
jgi:hypothetical protein